MTQAGGAAPRPTLTPPPAPLPGPAGPISAATARYALGLLVVVYVVNFLDRTILAMLLEPIKREFQVSDTYLGFLSGIAFAAFYTLMGIPIARWADRGSRRNIIALALVIWSGMTILTGFARSFAQLALCRVGVGVGEAGCSPPAHSLISDYFPPERRGRAFSIYALGIPIGGGLGYLAGGWLNEFFDWRTAFILAGVPGILLGIIVRFTLREPVRGAFDGAAASAEQEPVRAVLAFMMRLRSFRHMAIGAALHAFYGYGASAFIGAFFMRTHAIESGELGTWLALLGFTGGVAGTYLGGYLADRLGVSDLRWYMWVPALATLAYIPFAFLLYLWPDGRVALILWMPGALLGGMYLGPTFAMTQSLVRPRMRAMASAILLFVINIIGLGLGPQGVGILSDLLADSFGTESLRYALLVVVVSFALWSIVHYALAARSLREDLQAVQSESG
jgi:MFS family permease